MFFVLMILSRILFVASMVFILGYVFGNFSKSTTLKTITKVASLLVIVLFFAANAFFFRFGGWRHAGNHYRGDCYVTQKDSLHIK